MADRVGLMIKRLVDFLVSLTLLILMAPLLGLIALLVKATSKGPVLFRQERAGKDGIPFEMLKFRTMKLGAEGAALGKYISSDNPSITGVGIFLRRWGLDELPQLINVFRGEMSIVGPRPTLLYQVEKYDSWQRKRLAVKPGITGWAQVNGRNSLNWQQRMEYDIWYVEHWRLPLDFKILLATPRALWRRDFAFADGVSEDDIVTLPSAAADEDGSGKGAVQ